MDNSNAYTKNPPICNNYSSSFLVFDKGEGVYLYDIAGNKYLDWTSGIGVNALGHGRADYAEIIEKQSKKLMHASNLFSSVPTLTLAEKLTSLGDFKAVFFGNSGTEANEAALKYARIYSKKNKGDSAIKFLSFTSAFHGRSAGALSVTPNKKYQNSYKPLLDNCYVCEYNNEEMLENSLDKNFAAVIIEPIQGEGGLTCLTEGFAKKLNSLCEKYDIILIADEIQTGLCRTGVPFASAITGLDPDIINLAKPLAGGLPLSATLVKEKINNVISVGDHGTTFGGNPVSCALSCYFLDKIMHPDFIEHINCVSDYLKLRLENLSTKYGFVKKVKGVGLMIGLEIDKIPVADIIKSCEKEGLLILRSGENVLRFLPPFIISKKEIDEGVEILDKVFSNIKGE